jgi:hypothetical protein
LQPPVSPTVNTYYSLFVGILVTSWSQPIPRLMRKATRSSGGNLVAAVKEKRFTLIQRNFAAWIVLYRT